MKRWALALALTASTAVVGCANSRLYFDPSQPRIGYEAVQRRAAPLRVHLASEDRVRTPTGPMAVDSLRLQFIATEVLERSGVFTVVNSGDVAGRLVVRLTKTVVPHDSVGVALAYVLTLGLVGTTGTFHFDMDVTFVGEKRTVEVKNLRQTVFLASGANSLVPDEVERIDSGLASGDERAIERLLLRALQTMQQSGELPP